MRSKVTTPPATEPVTLEEVKASLRITNNAEDILLTQYIEDARAFVERATGRKLISQTVTAYYDGFEADLERDDWWSGHRRGVVAHTYGGQCLPLEFAPVQSVVSLETVATDGTEDLVDSSEYYLDNYDDDTRSVIRSDEGIVRGTRNENNIKAVYIAGYGANSADVPSPLRRSIIAMVGRLYATRGDCGDMAKCADDCGVDRMVGQYKLDVLR